MFRKRNVALFCWKHVSTSVIRFIKYGIVLLVSQFSHSFTKKLYASRVLRVLWCAVVVSLTRVRRGGATLNTFDFF